MYTLKNPNTKRFKRTLIYFNTDAQMTHIKESASALQLCLFESFDLWKLSCDYAPHN